MKKKVFNLFIVLLAILIIMPIAAFGGCNLNNNSKNTNQSDDENNIEQTVESDEPKPTVVGEGFIRSSYESLSGVSSDYEIALNSTIELTAANLTQYVAVSNQLEENISLSMRKEDEQYYLYEESGFTEGFTYSVTLLNDCVDFVDTRFSGKILWCLP